MDPTSFTTEVFAELPNVVKSSLRVILWKKGVYVCRRRNFNIANAIHPALEDKLNWPSEEFTAKKMTTPQELRVE